MFTVDTLVTTCIVLLQGSRCACVAASGMSVGQVDSTPKHKWSTVLNLACTHASCCVGAELQLHALGHMPQKELMSCGRDFPVSPRQDGGMSSLTLWSGLTLWTGLGRGGRDARV